MVGEQEHRPIEIVGKITNIDNSIAFLCDRDGNHYTVDQVIKMITSENYDFIIDSWNGVKTQISVKETEDGKTYLSTLADNELTNNLEALPEFS